MLRLIGSKSITLKTMKKITPLSKTYKKLGIAFTFPIAIEDKDGNRTYYETSHGTELGTKRSSCDGKVVEVDGKKYKLLEL